LEKEIEKITEEIQHLLAENLCSQMNPQKFVDWGVRLLERGYETENILILAGLDNYPREEIETYFWSSVNDLNIKLTKSDFELLENFAVYVANSILSKDMEPNEGLRIMNDIVRESDYSNRYIQFFNLEDDQYYLENDKHTHYNSFDGTDNFDEIIIEEFNLFLEAERINLEPKYREFAFCYACKSMDKPTLAAKRNWIGKIEYQYFVCPSCKSKNLEHFSTQKGKRFVLNELIKISKTL